MDLSSSVLAAYRPLRLPYLRVIAGFYTALRARFLNSRTLRLYLRTPHSSRVACGAHPWGDRALAREGLEMSIIGVRKRDELD